MFLNPYSIPPFVGSLLILYLGVFTFTKNKNALVNISFLIFTITLFFWLVFEGFLFSAKNLNMAIIFSKCVYIGVTGIPISILFLSLAILKLKVSKLLFVSFCAGYLITIFIIFKTDLILAGINKFFWGYYGKAGHWHIVYLIIWSSIYIRGAILLYTIGIRNKFNLYTADERNRFKYIFIIFLCGALGVLGFLAKYGLEIYPIGYLISPITCIIVTYAIVKHHLMDINIAIQKGLIYSVLVALITAGYFVFVIAIGELFQGLVRYQSFIINLCAIFAIAVLFNPLRNRIQKLLDKRFFKGTLESLAQERERLKQELFQVEKLAYVGGLASSVAHEIKNPLTAIKTFVEYLPQKSQDLEFKERFQKLIPQEIERIENVVYQLLDLAKPRTPVFKSVNIINTIDTTLSLLENNLKLKKIEVKKNYSSGEVTISGDEEQLRQVFLNLFLNSLQAMSEGGTLSIETKSSLESNKITVIIADSGCGITGEDLNKLFTPFFTTKKEGVGLGLAITQEILNQHKGEISVESEAGEGTTFIIKFPII